jgi:hypothetical protein
MYAIESKGRMKTVERGEKKEKNGPNWFSHRLQTFDLKVTPWTRLLCIMKNSWMLKNPRICHSARTLVQSSWIILRLIHMTCQSVAKNDKKIKLTTSRSIHFLGLNSLN